MPLRRDAPERASRSGGGGEHTTPLVQMGRSLRRARVQQGMTLSDAGARAGVSAGDADALESGSVARLTDQVTTVNALRRYADGLGLSGDRFALVLLDSWPVSPAGQAIAAPVPADWPLGAPVAGNDPGTTATGAPPGPSPASATGGAGTGQITAAVPTAASLRGDLGPWNAPSATGVVPAAGWGEAPHLLKDTGVTPAVTPSSRHRRRRGLGHTGTVLLRGLVALLVLLVLAGAAWLAVDHWRPQWLKKVDLPHSAITTPRASGSGTGTGHPATSTAAGITSSATGPNATTVTVHASGATNVAVVTAGGPSWVQVSDSAHPNPVFASVLAAGSTQAFPLSGVTTIQTGSSNAKLLFEQGTKVIGIFAPSAAPFTTTINLAG